MNTQKPHEGGRGNLAPTRKDGESPLGAAGNSGEEGLEETTWTRPAGYVWAASGVASATALFWLARGYLDKDHASLLYLPVVIACATRFGFGPAVLAAIGSFICWNFFFLPPFGTWVVQDPKDWLALFVFLVAALATAHLAAQARAQAYTAQSREREARALQQASAEISNEVEADRVLPVLARQLVTTCDARCSVIYRRPAGAGGEMRPSAFAGSDSCAEPSTAWLVPALACHQNGLPITDNGVFVPLRADGQGWGALYVGARRDGRTFSRPQERVILALANHAAVALARQALSDIAAQAQALRETEEMKNTLLSLVSHELRTPLAAIKAATGGLLLGGAAWEPETLTEALQDINDESDRLGALVGKLLDLSRLEAGAWKPDLDWCDLVDVLGTALARLPAPDGRRVQVVSPPNLPLVQADFVQIAQVMTNLLENAFKYAPPESPVTVTFTADSVALRVDVMDNGPGVPRTEAEAIFDRFYRLEPHRKQGVPGTGLGLAICRGIVEAHAGRIWERNAPEGSAVFSFTLPLPVMEAADA